PSFACSRVVLGPAAAPSARLPLAFQSARALLLALTHESLKSARARPARRRQSRVQSWTTRRSPSTAPPVSAGGSFLRLLRLKAPGPRAVPIAPRPPGRKRPLGAARESSRRRGCGRRPCNASSGGGRARRAPEPPEE